MSIVSRFLPKEKEPEYFLLLRLGLARVEAIIWEVKGDRTIIKGSGRADLDGTDMTEGADLAISEAEKKLPEGKLVEKVIFGLPLDYIENNAILPDSLASLKQLTKTLGLTPLGFIEIPQALTSFLRKKEDTPASALLVGVNKKTVSVSFLRVGKIYETRKITRGENVVSDIESGIRNLSEAEVLPSRILLYDGEEHLEDVKEELMKYPWHTKSSFLHIPKIGILRNEEIVNALVDAAAGEIVKQMTVEKEDVEASGPIEKNTEINDETEINDRGINEKDTASDEEKDSAKELGFVMDVDVAEENQAKEEAEATNEIADEPTSEYGSNVETEQSSSKKKFSFPKLPKVSMPSFNMLKNNSGGKMWIAAGILILILVIFGGYMSLWQLPHASVRVIVGSESMGKDVDVTIDPNARSVDTQNLIIPGNIADIALKDSKTIQTTGKKNIGSPAKGTVTIYNKSTQERSLDKGTVLLANNLKFTLDDDIKIASASDTGEGLTFGKSDAFVTANAIGTDGNLPQDTQFSLADYLSSEFSAKANKTFSGGTSRQVDAVSKTDRDNLLDELTKSLKLQGESEIRTKVGNDEQILDNSVSFETTNSAFDKDAGDEGSELTLNLEGKVTGITYKTSDLNSLAEKYITDTIPSGFKFSDNGTALEAKSVDIQDDGTVKISAFLKASLLPIIDLENIKKSLAGKSIEETQNYLRGRDNITGVEINIDSPLPIEKNMLPRNPANISISIATQ